ncbi:MAG: 3-dehydroquinate synthase [Rhodospirillales bacterium]|nr:3-dehydroquinate synthase [Rhodospirillales bacterium]
MSVAGELTTTAATDRINVDLGERSYDIIVGDGLLVTAGRRLRPLLTQPRVVIVTDETVARLHLDPLHAALAAAEICHATVVLPAGEGTKDFTHLAGLCERVLESEIERGTMLVALGGGVIGDITGFAAGILLRGLDFIQIPTTLLAQVDSSVGGKTGINSRHGKNLVGLFHQPRLVLADIGTLSTLDPRHVRAGYAEVVKYGLLGDPAFFGWLEENAGKVLALDAAALRQAVAVSCRAKAAVVRADERESGARALLNLGHTFGHALEAEMGFCDALLHGEAVAVGMALAFDFSARLGLAPAGDAAAVRRHLARAGLPTDLSLLAGRTTSADALIAHMRSDKKVKDGRLTFILVRGIGAAFVCREVDESDLRSFLADALARGQAGRPA